MSAVEACYGGRADHPALRCRRVLSTAEFGDLHRPGFHTDCFTDTDEEEGSLLCGLCGLWLHSILYLTQHMKKEHNDSEHERNDQFCCRSVAKGFTS